jgi:hypothetical protein
MDLFQKFGLRILSWEENIKLFNEEDNKDKLIKEVTLKNGECVLLVEIKDLSELSSENFIRICHLLASQSTNFINLKYVLINADEKMFFAYQKTGQRLMDYMKNEMNFENKLLLYKQVVEIVHTLTTFNENFLNFDFNFFYIQETLNKSVKMPLLKLIYHGNK